MEAQAQIANAATGAPAAAAKLRPNPFAQVTVRSEAGVAVELRIWCVTRSRGAVTRNFARGQHANFERVYQAAAGAGAGAAKSLPDLVLLAALGLWAPEDDLIDPVHFHAPLRPRLEAMPQPAPLDAFALRGEVWLQQGAEPPAQLAGFPLGCLAPARPILWHQGAPSEPILPWWPTAECLAAIAALQGSAPRRPDMMPALLALAEQGIAVCEPAMAEGDSGPGSKREDQREFFARQFFSRDGFAALGRILPPGQIAAWRGYWQKFAALEVMPDRGDNGARLGSNGEPSSALLLHLLQPLVARIAGADIKPAYSYAWIYRRGATMPSHRDRDPCRYTLSVLVDYAPAVDGPTPWPLGIHPRGGGAPLEIRQSIGDAVIFNGQELSHFRPPFAAGTQSTSLLLHYVDRDFTGVMF
jgi:hypothetical protein